MATDADGGGTPPPVMDLLVTVFEDYRDNFMDRFLSGLGMMLIALPLTLLALMLVYVIPVIGALPGMIIEDELLMLVGAILGFVVGVFAMILAVTAIITPMYASLMRATARNMVDETDLGIGAPFSTVTQDLGSVLLLGVLLAVVGPLSMVLVFAMPGIVVHRLSPVDAIKRAGAHFLEEPGWHIGFVALKFCISIVLSYIPFVGSAILYPFIVRYELLAYMAVFGDGSEA